MWGRKKTDEWQTASPEPKSEPRNVDWNQFSGLSASLQEARQQEARPSNKDAEGPRGATGGSVAAAGFGAKLQMKGEITGSQDLVIEGTFEGVVRLGEGKLTIGKTAKVTADIVASEVTAWGRVKGNVRAKNCIEIRKEGAVTGDLTTQQILIEVGAFFKGSIETESDGVEKGVDRSALSSAPPAPARPTAAA